MIKDVLQRALADINALKSQALAQRISKARTETIAPENQRLDKVKNEAIAELTAKYNEDIRTINEQTTAKKVAFEKSTIDAITSETEALYARQVSALEKQIADVGDNI